MVLRVYVDACVCVCVCEGERERERERARERERVREQSPFLKKLFHFQILFINGAWRGLVGSNKDPHLLKYHLGRLVTYLQVSMAIAPA